jgi:hypothetical protein
MLKHDPYTDVIFGPANLEMRKASGRVNIDSALVTFIYLLTRDHLPAGDVEELVRKASASDQPNMYTNGWLATLAEYQADRLRG